MALVAIRASGLAPQTISCYGAAVGELSTLLEFNPDQPSGWVRVLANVEGSYDMIKDRWPNPVTRAKILTAVLAVLKLTRLQLPPKVRVGFRVRVRVRSDQRLVAVGNRWPFIAVG